MSTNDAKPVWPRPDERLPEEADMDRMRIDREMNGSDDTTPTLDRAWAATRPPELSADAFDRIWANIQAPATTARPRCRWRPFARGGGP